jgi:hypothetical protein
MRRHRRRRAHLISGRQKTSEKMLTESNPQTPNVAATPGMEIDNILGAAKEDAGYEQLLKFRKGVYFRGEEAVALGTEYIAHAIGWAKCWLRFINGEVVERKVYRVAFGERPPEREDLGDLEKGKWPEGIDGNPSDPWLMQYLLPLEKVSDGEVVIFTTSSIGGRRAIADLCAAWAKRKRKNANCGQPIARLGKAEMSTKKFGKVPRPEFDIVGWDEPPADAMGPSYSGGPPPVCSADEFEDSIPF